MTHICPNNAENGTSDNDDDEDKDASSSSDEDMMTF